MPNPRTLAILLFSVGGCSSSAGPSGPSAAELQAFTRVSNVLLVPVDVGGTTGLLGVDTGDPFVLLNPTTFPKAPAVGAVGTLSVESDDLTNVQVITSSLSPTSPDPAITLGGLLGCTVLCSSVVTFDYRDALFTFGDTSSASGLLAPTQVAFSLEGGSTMQLGGVQLTVPTSRIVVSVAIEGATHRMIVDTGASAVTVDQSVFAALTSDGRVQRSGGMLESTSGASTASVTRAKTISVGGVQAQAVVVAYDPSFDSNLAAISTDAGETIEGSLGGTFLENFNLTIDYPNRALHFAPYADNSFIIDPAEALGFVVETMGNGVNVAAVVPGTDAAAKGVQVGDAVLAIEGQTLASLTVSQLGVLMGGKVGSTKAVQFGAAQTLANQTVSIKVDEFLPLP
jgi:aspartyl protease/PDZ domain-containing protein